VLRRVWAPALYQGGRVGRRYFEGWYFKCVDAGERRAVAVIPGVSYSADGRRAQSFVQVLREGGCTRFFSFPAGAFRFDPSPPFRIAVDRCTFAETGMTLDLRDEDGAVEGEVTFGRWSPWPVTLRAPGIMGWYRYVPRMECYHGVLSMDHELGGGLTVDGEELALEGGRGYVEKDWGRSFPSSWVWLQSNHFGRSGVSVTCSVAKIPWFSGSFVGHIAGLLVDGRLHRFATYTGAALAAVETRPGGARVVLRDAREELEIAAEGAAAGALKAPVLGAMEGRADEALGAAVHVRLRELRGGRAVVVFEGDGAHAGLEVMNERGELVADEPRSRGRGRG
jgi:tocopherol cyclase